MKATLHGIGFALNYMLRGRGLKCRFYGFRMLINTLFYRLFGLRLPGSLGDTLCQTSRRMAVYYRESGLHLEREQVVGVVMEFPQFICHRVVKNTA